MGRWEPDAKGRMRRAALDLFAERGFEQTRAAEIAERAGVTERTFFRHFPDKREVLFDGAHHLQEAIVAGIAAAPPQAAPLEAVLAGLVAGAQLLDHDYACTRAAVIAANPGLRERELLKLATLSEGIAEALRARGVSETVAGLAADSGSSLFHAGFVRWIAGPPSVEVAECIRAAYAELRALVGT